jgi:hypothetical protein
MMNQFIMQDGMDKGINYQDKKEPEVTLTVEKI